MNAKTNCMSRHGGQPEGVKGQKAVAPTFLDRLFHQRQAQLKSTPTAVIRAESSRPLFYRLCAGQGGIQDAVFLFAVIFIATNFIGG